MNITEVLTRYKILMQKLREMNIAPRPFCEWIKAVRDFEETKKQNA